MAEAIIMPKTGMTMKEGVIIEWLKKEGDQINDGDVLAEIETDKSTMELESDVTGILLKIVYPAGTTVPVTVPIAWIGKKGEEIPEDSGLSPSEVKTENETPAPEKPAPVQSSTRDGGTMPSTPAAKRLAAERGIDLSAVTPSGKHGEIRKQDVLSAAPKATPLASRIAEDRQIDLSGVTGSGEGGKIFSRDVIQRDVGEDRKIPLTNVQKITGRRMLESLQSIPMVTEDIKADVTRLLDLKQEILQESGVKVSVNDFIIRGVALALREHPRMNAVFDNDALIYKHEINLGMATATEKGLFVPVIRQADRYTLSALAERTKELISHARAGKLSPDELSGSTFSISNVGMYGVTSFTPIINPPEAGILGVCSIERLPRFIEGELCERSIITLSLTFDHRVVDGAESALFLSSLVDLLQSPLKLLV